MNSEHRLALQDDELKKIGKELAAAKADYQAAVERNLSLEHQFLATEELLQRAREKVKLYKRKGIEADHYKALIHDLRSRWYLRPFIPLRKLLPPCQKVDCWRFRGPRFAPSRGERPRVLVVGHLLSTMLFGSENSLLETIFAIDPERFDIFAIFPEQNASVFARLQAQVQGIAVIEYGWWRLGRTASQDVVRHFENLLRQQEIDLVHVNTIMLLDPLVAARRLGVPSIVHARELISLDDELAARLGGTPAAIVKGVCENASYLLANSAATLADYPCGSRGSYLYNGIDAQAFDLPNRVDPNVIKVGLISSNLLKKGVADFLKLAHDAEKVFPSLEFYLIGPENDLIRKWSEGSHLPRNFHIRGYLSHPPDAYRDLNLILNLSRFAESFGRTVAEAMMARRPVIAYRHGALPELIEDAETGFLVPYLDLGAVLDRLRFFVEQPAKITEFGETARQRSLERFSGRVFADRINSLYERLIAEARQTGSAF